MLLNCHRWTPSDGLPAHFEHSFEAGQDSEVV